MGLIQKLLNGGKLKKIALIRTLDDFDKRISALEGNSDDDELNGSDDNTESEPQSPLTRDISITVTDGNEPYHGANVSIGDIEGVTGSAGGCTLKDVPDGEHTIIVTGGGLIDYSDTITVSAENTSFTITVTPEIQPEIPQPADPQD